MIKNYLLKSSFDVSDYSLAVEFYSNVLCNVSPYKEYPINQLIGHRGQAPLEVQRVAVNVMDLKKFLLRYPTIFKVTERNGVKLEATIADYSYVGKDNSDESVQYYANILRNKYPGNNFIPIKNLIGYRSQGSDVVRLCAKNVNELYSFLCNHPDTFTVLPDKSVALKKSFLVTDGKNKGENQASKSENECDSTLAIEYYSRILKNANPYYSVHRLIGHRGQAPPEVQRVAVTGKQLLSFLSRFPNLFTITGESVALKKTASALDYSDKKSSAETTIDYYASILKEKGYCGKEYPIIKLSGYRGQAPYEVQKCAKNPQELYSLFSNHPDIFTLTPRKGVILIESPFLSNITSKVQNLSLKSDTYSGDSTKAVEFYCSFLRKWFPKSECPILNLTDQLNQAPLEVRRVATNEEELISFFLKYPNIFTIRQNKFVKLTETSISPNNIQLKPVEHSRSVTGDKKLRTSGYFPPIECPENLEFVGTWEDHVLNNTFLITEEEECLDACEVIKNETVIALDCEGYNLGRGIISFIQIGLINGKVYIFDIYELPDMITFGLKDILESEKILKVINYCRNDCLNLSVQFDVNVKYIFDVSVAYHVIECRNFSLSNFKPAGFNQICDKYGVPTNSYKDDLKFVYLSQPNYWITRPITLKMVSYAAFDVASLVPYLYIEFLKRMDQETEIAVWRLSQRMCLV